MSENKDTGAERPMTWPLVQAASVLRIALCEASALWTQDAHQGDNITNI